MLKPDTIRVIVKNTPSLSFGKMMEWLCKPSQEKENRVGAKIDFNKSAEAITVDMGKSGSGWPSPYPEGGPMPVEKPEPKSGVAISALCQANQREAKKWWDNTCGAYHGINPEVWRLRNPLKA